MSVSEDFLEHLGDLLAALGPVRRRRMFGGIGLYAGELFFAIIDEDVLYLKVDDETEAQFQAAGSQRFTYPMKDGRVGTIRYWRLPDAALDEPDEAVRWARLALDAARRAEAAAARKKPVNPLNPRKSS